MLVEPESRTGAKLNVLCAEDNAFERSAIAELFRSTNETYLANGTPMQFEVHLVPSIDAVLAALSTAHEPFSIVMLDVNLGSDESSETIIGLVRQEVGERVPIVLFSATAHMDQARVASARPGARVVGPPRALSFPPTPSRTLAGAAVPAARRRRVRHEAAAARLLHTPLAVLSAPRPALFRRHHARPPQRPAGRAGRW
jgi:CheY-like chemotaxis protein